MSLTPEERQRIYEEEKARREAQSQIKDEKRKGGCLGCLGVIGVLFLVGAIISSFNKSPTTTTSADSTGSMGSVVGKEELIKQVATISDALGDMKANLAGDSMDHMNISLQVFNASASLIQRVNAEELTSEEKAKVTELRRKLVLRQRETFPVIRKKAGPIFSKELWISDAKAYTSGARSTTIMFVAGEFAAHANIQKAQEAIRATLVRMRFKRACYEWYEDADDASCYTMDTPADGDIAIVDLDGNVTPVPTN